MKIIQPKVELWRQGEDAKKHVVRCARICYRRNSGNDDATYNHLIKSHHYSVFRHETVYCIVDCKTNKDVIIDLLLPYTKCLLIKWIYYEDYIYIATNGNFLLDISEKDTDLYDVLVNCRVTEVEFLSDRNAFERLARWTFCIDTQISTSRELNRVSPNNIVEQSTRYVYEDGTICRPHWLNGWNISETLNGKYVIYKNGKEDEDVNHKVLTYIHSCRSSFDNYKYLIKAGLNRQDARGVLPIDTATRCAYTYSIEEWRAIIDLRYYGVTGVPHPNAKIIAGMIRNELIALGYEFR